MRRWPSTGKRPTPRRRCTPRGALAGPASRAPRRCAWGDLQALLAEGDVLVLCCAASTPTPTTRDAMLLAFNLGTRPRHGVAERRRGCTSAQPLFSHGGAALHGAQLHLPAGAVLVAPLA